MNVPPEQNHDRDRVKQAPIFAMLVAGRRLEVDFVMSGNKAMADIVLPDRVREFSVVILRPALPAGFGVAVCWSLPPYQDFQYVGSLSLDVPSATFRAPWHGRIRPSVGSVRIGLSVEPLDVLKQMVPSDIKEEEAVMENASGIAKDLFTYMSSFTKDAGEQHGNMLVIPVNCIDLWLKKFTAKHRAVPYYWLKKN